MSLSRSQFGEGVETEERIGRVEAGELFVDLVELWRIEMMDSLVTVRVKIKRGGGLDDEFFSPQIEIATLEMQDQGHGRRDVPADALKIMDSVGASCFGDTRHALPITVTPTGNPFAFPEQCRLLITRSIRLDLGMRIDRLDIFNMEVIVVRILQIHPEQQFLQMIIGMDVQQFIIVDVHEKIHTLLLRSFNGRLDKEDLAGHLVTLGIHLGLEDRHIGILFQSRGHVHQAFPFQSEVDATDP